MIVPDGKDWTWVLERPCPECGFDASTCAAAAVPGLVRENAARWRQLLADGLIRPGRPDPAVWSPLEYACHVRDVYERYDHRIFLMVTERNPLYPNWDQDASAITDRYEEQEPSEAVARLTTAAEALAVRLEDIAPADYERRGRRSDGAQFTVDSIARYMIHDPIHHVWDVTTLSA
jgi:DinB superfamily